MGGPQIAQSNAELRLATRRRILFPGKIVSRDASFSSECVLRNVSQRGARIQVPSGGLFPPQLYLISARLPVAYEAEVIWRRGNQVGLKFLQSLDLSEGNKAAPHFVRQLYSELCPRESRRY